MPSVSFLKKAAFRCFLLPPYSSAKKFSSTSLKFYPIPITVIKHLPEFCVCVFSKGSAASDAHKQIEMIWLFTVKKKRRNKKLNSCTPKLWICCKRRATELDGKQCTWSMWANAGDCTWGVNADSLCNAVYPKCMRCLLKMVQRRFSLVKWN